jgi:hypothetical protein
MIAPDVDRWAPFDELVRAYGAQYGGPEIGPQTREQFDHGTKWARIWVTIREDTEDQFFWD